MKAAIVAAAAAVLAGGVSANHGHNHHRRHKALFEKKGLASDEVCTPGCTTIYSTITGDITSMWGGHGQQE